MNKNTNTDDPQASPFAWIQPYQTGDDCALAIWNQADNCYELPDGDRYTYQQLANVWHPRWLSWAEVRVAVAAWVGRRGCGHREMPAMEYDEWIQNAAKRRQAGEHDIFCRECGKYVWEEYWNAAIEP